MYVCVRGRIAVCVCALACGGGDGCNDDDDDDNDDDDDVTGCALSCDERINGSNAWSSE